MLMHGVCNSVCVHVFAIRHKCEMFVYLVVECVDNFDAPKLKTKKCISVYMVWGLFFGYHVIFQAERSSLYFFCFYIFRR